MKPISAVVDLSAVFIVTMAMWSLRFLEIFDIGPITMAVSLVLVFALLAFRSQSPSIIGLDKLPSTPRLFTEAGRLLPLRARNSIAALVKLQTFST